MRFSFKQIVTGVVATAVVCAVGFVGLEMMKGASNSAQVGRAFDTLVTSTCGGEWAQCGGSGYTGSTCCKGGYVCTYSSPQYSYCAQNKSLTGCNVNYAPCGGSLYTGSSAGVCCSEDYTCYSETSYYSQCKPTGSATSAPTTAAPTTKAPTSGTPAPTKAPTSATSAPTKSPTSATSAPTKAPTSATSAPTSATSSPTKAPTTKSPTAAPTTAGCVADYLACNSTYPTCCNSGFTCYVKDIYYSQCRPTGDTFPPSTAYPTTAPTNAPTTASPTVSPTKAPTTASPTASPTVAGCVIDYGACNNVTNTACCSSGFTCYVKDIYYSQCRPTGDTFPPSTASPTNAPTKAPTTKSPTLSPTTKAPTTSSPTKAPTTSAPTSTCVANYGKCNGKNADGSAWTGPTTCCGTGFTCKYQNEWYSQCLN